MNKSVKKIIVNLLTVTRVIATILMPLMVSCLSAPVFLLSIGLILFTDCLDGVLARKWDVSTIFGSIADMAADKLFGFSILVVLSTMFPIMIIPLILETLIAGVNVDSFFKGSISKSSELGRLKTWIMGLSICSLLFIGLLPEINQSLEAISISNIHFKEISDLLFKNKDNIIAVSATATIVSEGIVLSDYFIKNIKNKDKDSRVYKIADLIKNKKYIKEIILKEDYYKATKDVSFKEKLFPTEEEKEVIKKKLLQYNENKLDKK